MTIFILKFNMIFILNSYFAFQKPGHCETKFEFLLDKNLALQ